MLNIKLSAFSLIELMVSIVVLAILLGLAAPSFTIWLQNLQIRNAAESILSGLQRARAEAVGRNANIEFVLVTHSSWVVRVAGGANIDTRSSSEGARNATVAVIPTGATTVTFNSFGGLLAANADGSLPFTRVDIDSSVLAANDSQNLRITIGVGGNVRMCDPNAPASSLQAC